MLIIPIRTPIISPTNNLASIILRSIRSSGVTIEDGDILAIASKVVSVAEGRVVNIAMVEPSSDAKTIASKYDMDPRFVQIIMEEADEILGGVYRTLLTIKDGIMIANAGADLSNNPEGYASLWPLNPDASAMRIRTELEQGVGKRVGVLIIDSRTTPLRLGTSGIAIGIAGLNPVRDYRGKKDLFGKRLHVTTLGVADAIAAAAHLVMGEADESTPVAIVKGAEVKVNSNEDPRVAKMPKERCLYMKVLLDHMCGKVG